MVPCNNQLHLLQINDKISAMVELTLREVNKLPFQQRFNHQATDLLNHRKRLAETAERNGKWNKSMVCWSEELAHNRSLLERGYPNLDFNLWMFERGKTNLEIIGIFQIYRSHYRVDYKTENGGEKSALLKQTPHARFERFHTKLARIVKNPSYKILCVDDHRDSRGNWERIQLGWKHLEEGMILPDEDVIPYLGSSYAVIEWVHGEGMDSYAQKFHQLKSRDQEILAHNLGRIAGFNLLFGAGTDFKPEHVIVNPNSLDCTRIDHEHAFMYFDPNAHTNMAIEIGLERQLLGNLSRQYNSGINSLVADTIKHWNNIANLVMRISKFGAVGYEAKVQPIVLEQIKNQIALVSR